MKYYYLLLILLLTACTNTQKIEKVAIVFDTSSPRVEFGAEKLTETLKTVGFQIESDTTNATKNIVILSKKSKLLNQYKTVDTTGLSKKEGFKILSKGETIYIIGADESGALYGALQLADDVEKNKVLPDEINLVDSPEMVLRGTCIGMQKPTYLEGRGVYEYPYTPENFPWFYDKELWVEYLDMMVENRYNSLYLWNGHPFASLVKLDDYPFAVEVSDETFEKNKEMFKFLTEEANKRGIWVIQMFYNIIVSKPFAEHYNIKTQDRQRPITPLIADYTQKSIAKFIEDYPNVGLLVALGEAMNTYEDDVEWFTKTIIPGVKDGLEKLGRTDEPPIILRAHDTDAAMVMESALPLYKNLYTTHKYNGESLTTYQPRGPWSKIHQDLSSLGSVHISNVHILANLEPFRFGSPDFIQKSVLAMHNVHGANGLHLYPQASYWDWPYTADNTEPRLLEMDRDQIWYKAWGRYAWNVHRDRAEEITYWSHELAEKFGTDTTAAKNIVEAYEQTGEIAPKTLRRFGITEGNRQTLLLGMFESQLVNPYKWRVYPGFYESCGPLGEILIEYAKKEWNKEPHEGETPVQIINEIRAHGKLGVEAIDAIASSVTKNKDEFKRLQNDVHAYKAFADNFAEKVEVALLVLHYSYSNDIADLDKVLPHLEQSLEHYKKLVSLTEDAYLYANSMQTAQRRIPIGGDDGHNKTWKEMLPHYERELANFKRNLELLKASDNGEIVRKAGETWKPVDVAMVGNKKSYTFQKGTKAYNAPKSVIEKIAPELEGLKAIYIDEQQQIDEGTHLSFQNEKPVKLVVGYFNTDAKRYLLPPSLETDAAGNAHGQAEVILANAVNFKDLPRLNIHTYTFDAGQNELHLGKGRVLILGFIDAEQAVKSRDVGFIGKDEKEAVDWLFY